MKPIEIINKLNESNVMDVKAMSDKELLSLYSDLMYDVETGQWNSEHNLIPTIEEELEKRDIEPTVDYDDITEADQSWRYEVMESQLKNDEEIPIWVVGWVRVGNKKYNVSAKVYMEPSKFGINEGPTSKLYIEDTKGNVICNYERGWEVRPEGNDDIVVNAIIDKVEDFRERNPYKVNESDELKKTLIQDVVDDTGIEPGSDEEKKFEDYVLDDFTEYISYKYDCDSLTDTEKQLNNVSEDDVNDYFSGKFYDIENGEDLDDLNRAEEIIRQKYNLVDSLNESHSDEYCNLAASDFVADKMYDEFGNDWRNMPEDEILDAVRRYTNEYGYANVEPEYTDEDFYGDEADYREVYKILLGRNEK